MSSSGPFKLEKVTLLKRDLLFLALIKIPPPKLSSSPEILILFSFAIADQGELEKIKASFFNTIFCPDLRTTKKPFGIYR